MKQLILDFILFTMLLFLGLLAFYFFGKSTWYPYYEKCFLEKPIIPTIEKNTTEITRRIPTPPVIEKLSPVAEKLSSEKRLNRLLADSNFIMYPQKLTIIGLKHEQILEVWGERNGQKSFIGIYPFTAFSGHLGPKFKSGDRQIPEGIYKIGYLNPNSKFHLSMQLNYPNDFDKRMAQKEKRTNLGGEIMIHGKNVTVGCIPIGDQSIEELYYLVEKVGIKNTKVILAPVDFRTKNVNILTNQHPWIKDLYANIRQEMQTYQ